MRDIKHHCLSTFGCEAYILENVHSVLRRITDRRNISFSRPDRMDNTLMIHSEPLRAIIFVPHVATAAAVPIQGTMI